MRLLITLVTALGLTLSSATWAQNLRDLELSYLRAAVPVDLLPYATIEIPAIENIRLGSDARGSRLELRTYFQQPLKNGGVRAELSVDYPYREGDTVRYSWRMMLPSNFPSDAPSNRWWLVAQWHDQPDRTRGETWAGYPGHSPSVGLGYGQIAGQDQLSLQYGAPNPSAAGLIPISRGVWQSIRVEITWSRGPSGRVKVFLNDGSVPVREANGPNMYNSFQHYMKVGMYRHPDIPGDAWIYIADVGVQIIPP